MEKMKITHHELEPGTAVSKELRRRVLSDLKRENRRIVRNQIMALSISILVFGLLVVVGWRIFLWLYSGLK
ncbi:MAG: hypothetical protein JXR65_03120 [Bacteroidales bacterium]|nr:hypothetical protein [Bacteroidales bacterium]